MNNQENPDNTSKPTPPPTPGLTRPPVGKPKFKLTPKSGKKPGAKSPLKLSGKKPLPITQPPFQKSPSLTSETKGNEDINSLPTPSLPSSLESATESPVPTPKFGVPNDGNLEEKVAPSPPSMGERVEFNEESTENEKQTPLDAPGLPEMDSAEGSLPPPPPLGESVESTEESTEDEKESDTEEPVPPPPPIMDSAEGSLPPPPVLGESVESTEESNQDEKESDSEEPVPPLPPIMESAEGSLPPPPVLGESTESTEESGPSLKEGTHTDEDSADMDSPKSLEDEFEDDDEDDGEDVDEFEEDDEEESNTEEDSSEMTPFEISENFRNLKVNIVMIKAKLKEISEDENSTNNSNFSEQIEDLENKFSESEQKREENKKIILSLMDEIHDLKKREREESTAESEKENSSEISEKIDALLSEKELTNETINLLKEEFKVVQSKIEGLQNNSSETVDISSLETNIKQVFDKIDDINSDKSEFKSKIANIESKLEDEKLRTNEEIPPPPPPSEDPSSSGLSTRVEDLEDIINDATSAIHELSEEFHSFQDETKEFNEKSSPSSENPENFSELEKTINEIRSQMDDLSVEPPPPPPIDESKNEDANQQLISTVENLEKRMSNFENKLQSEIDNLKESISNADFSSKDLSDSKTKDNPITDESVSLPEASKLQNIRKSETDELSSTAPTKEITSSEFTFRGMTKTIDEWKHFILTSDNRIIVNQLRTFNILR